MKQRNQLASRVLGVFFITAGLIHFVATDEYVAMMPVYLPWHEELVYLSGLLELAGGIGVMTPAFRRASGIGLIVLLVAVFPANVHVAMHGLPVGQTQLPVWGLWLRLPLQIVFLYWVAKTTLFDESLELYSSHEPQ